MRLLLAALFLLAAPASGQTPADPAAHPPGSASVDVAVLRAVYGVDAPAATGVFRVVDRTAYPVFLGTVPAVGVAMLASGEPVEVPFRMGAAQVGAAALTMALKQVVRRPRPYAALSGIAARDPGHQAADVFDPHAFPSGHTAIAAALATSLSLSVPEWYVVVPAAAWATAMGVGRVWHGVHYPSDVLVGAGIGVASAVAVHLFVPAFLGSETDTAAPLRVAIAL